MVLNFRKEGFYSKSRKSPRHAYIDPNARGTLYIILYAYGIYTAVRHKIPLPGYRVSRVTRVSGLGSPWSRVFAHGHWSYGHPGFWVTGSIGSLVSGLSMAMISIGSWARVKPTTQGSSPGSNH